MERKECITSAMDAGYFDNLWKGCESRPKTIQWCKSTDGSYYESETLKEDEKYSKVICQCGKYMKTHLHEHSYHDKNGNAYGKSWYEMIVTCTCDAPKPTTMECENIDEEINILLDDIIKNIEGLKSLMKQNEGDK